MKHFITIIVITLATLLASSINVNAQYLYPVNTTVQYIYPVVDSCVNVNFSKLPDEVVTQYNDIKESINCGKILCGCGVVFESVGTYVLIAQPYPDIKSSIFLGCSFLGLGLALDIVGISMWYEGAVKLNELKINYAISNGGLIVTF